MKKLLLLLALFLFQFAHAQESIEEHPIVIIGGGIGALTSATYLSRAGTPPIVLLGPNPGGSIVQSPSVENWPGELGISGADLFEKVQSHAEASGAILRWEVVTGVDFSKRPFTITTYNPVTQESKTLRARACIIASGAVPNMLHIAGETTYWSRGVYSCAICDGSFYKDQVIAIVGGGDSALTEARYLSNIGKKIYVIVRKDQFKTVEIQRKNEILSRPNVEVLFRTTVEEIKGDGQKVTHLILQQNGKQIELPINALFLAIGAKPNTELFRGQLELDNNGYIKLKKQQQTSVEGVYAIGDVVDHEFKQAITAAGDGAKAALQAQKELPSFATNHSKAELTSHIDVITTIQSLNDLNQEIQHARTPIFLYFFSKTCPPCKTFSPQYSKWAQDYSGKIRFLKVNTSDTFDLNARFEITAVPTLIILDKNGHILRREIGTGAISSIGRRLQALKHQDTIDFSTTR